MSDRIIRSLFEARLKAWASARVPALPIAYEDVAFTPPANNARYLKIFLLPGSTDSDDLEGKHTSYRGVLQISVVTKAGEGRGAAGLIADEISALYPNNMALTKAEFTVFIRSPMATAGAIQGDTTSSLPLSFQYRADTF
ncbi:MAG: phage tail terminator-like protein [Pseudomonas sp.]